MLNNIFRKCNNSNIDIMKIILRYNNTTNMKYGTSAIRYNIDKDNNIKNNTVISTSNKNNKKEKSFNNNNSNNNKCSTNDDNDDEDDLVELEEMFVMGPKGMEWNGPTRGGQRPEPTRYGDWERKGRTSDF